MNRTTENAVTTTGAPIGGRARDGMWQAAWRLHRRTVTVTVTAAVVLLGVMVAFRLTFDAAAREYLGAAYQACTVDRRCPDGFSWSVYRRFSWWRTLQGLMAFVPAVAGVLVGVSAFARELDQRSVVFATTQGVGRVRWWGVTLTVVGLPLVLVMLPVGFVLQWASQVHPWFSELPFQLPYFAAFGMVPAAMTLVAVAVGAFAGLLVRGPLAALAVGLALAAATLGGVEAARSHLLTPVVTTYPANGDALPSTLPGADDWNLESGWLDAQGRQVPFDACSYDASSTDEEVDAAWERCLTDAGITQRFDSALPGDRIGELRWAVTGVVAGLAAVFLAAGAVVLRRRAL